MVKFKNHATEGLMESGGQALFLCKELGRTPNFPEKQFLFYDKTGILARLVFVILAQ